MAGGHGHGALARHQVAAGENAGCAGHQVGVDGHAAITLEHDAIEGVQEAAVGLLAERQHHGVGLQRFELAGRLRLAVGAQHHGFKLQRARVDLVNAAEPFDGDAFVERFLRLEGLRLHVGAVLDIDDHRFLGAEPARRARGIHGRVAGAVHRHPAPQLDRRAGGGVVQQADGSEHMRGVAPGDVDAPADLGADGDEHCVEFAGRTRGGDIGHRAVQGQLHAKRHDPVDLALQVGARQAVGGNSEVHHASRLAGRFLDFDKVAGAAQMPGRGQPGRT